MTGGESFQFTDVDGQIIQVDVTGDTVLELIGAKASNNEIKLGDLAGEFSASTIGRNGAQIGIDGSELIGRTEITDPLSEDRSTNEAGEIAIEALASNTSGDTYGFNILDVEVGDNTQRLLQLLSIDNTNGDATVIADLFLPVTVQDDNIELVSSSGPLQTDQGTATDGNDLNFLNGDIAVSLTGAGSVTVHDNDLSDNNIDALVLNGTNQFTEIQITSADDRIVSVDRVLSDNGETVQSVTIDDAEDAIAGVAADSDSLVTLNAVRAAAFNPLDDDLLYFVAELGPDGDGDPVQRLFRVDVTDTTVVEQATGDFNEQPVESIAFDQTGPSASRLLALAGTGTLGGATGPNEILELRFDASNFTDPASTSVNAVEARYEVQLNGGSFSGLTGLEVFGDDPTAEDTTLLALESDGVDSSVFQVELTGELAVLTDFETATDFDDDESPFRGWNFQSLSYNPTLVDPFTGELGAYIATDATTDDLMYINTIERGFNQLFALYISNADEQSAVRISAINVTTDDQIHTPFTGVSELNEEGVNAIVETSNPVYDLFIGELDDDDPIVSFADDVGGVFIGAKEFVKRPGAAEDDPPEPLRPVLNADLTQAIGVLPAPVSGELTAGVTLAPSLLEFFSGETMANRLLGENIDEAAGIAVKSDLGDADSIVVIDSDETDEGGNAITADQLATVDSVTGRADTPVSVQQSGSDLLGVKAFGYGDHDFDGVEDLFAVYDIGGTLTLGTIDTSTGEFTTVGALDAALQSDGVQALAFSPVQSPNATSQRALYVVSQDNAIYEVDASNGSTLAGGDDIEDSEGNAVTITSMAFNFFGDLLLAHDSGTGRLVDLDLAGIGSGTVVAGEQVATEVGTINPSVGGIAYDPQNDRYLAVDNATGGFFLGATEGSAAESAALMVLRGITGTGSAGEVNTADTAQNIDDIFIGGRVTGAVDLSGSIQTFYAGSLLTGEINGFTVPENNFRVDGDIRNLVAGVSIGVNRDEPSGGNLLNTGVNISVGGQLGQIWALEDAIGDVTVDNSDVAPTFPVSFFSEIEGRSGGENPIESNWLQGRFFDTNGRFFNDSFDTAHRLGTLRNHAEGALDHTRVRGAVSGGDADYYSIALLEGQTVELQLDDEAPPTVTVALVDPEGRVVATNMNDTDNGVVRFEPFRFTTQMPGEYRIRITDNASAAYDVTIRDVGELALGGIRSGDRTTTTVEVQKGHAGGFYAGGSMGLTATIIEGDLRSIDSVSSTGALLEVRGDNEDSGRVGLVRSTEGAVGLTTGNLGLIRETFDDSAFVDGNIQLIDADGNFNGILATNASIGSIRAASMLGDVESTFLRVNADDTGSDGFIDLIDIDGDLGSGGGVGFSVPDATGLQTCCSTGKGGPGIATGPGGNVGFLRVGGTVYQDRFFRGDDYFPQVLEPGESFLHVDDGGAETTFTPTQRPNPAFNPSQPVDPVDNPRFLGGQLTVSQYGVRGSGGSVLINVTSSSSLNIESAGASTSAGAVHVGEINITADGQSLAANENTGAITADPSSGQPVNLEIRGPVDVNVLNTSAGAINKIVNSTLGEMVQIEAGSIEQIDVAGPLGLASSGRTLLRPGTFLDEYPFDQTGSGVSVSGDVATIRADRGLGNISVQGALGEVFANDNASNDTGAPEGVLAPIFGGSTIQLVNFGEALAPAGTGDGSRGGIYAIGRIERVVGQDGGNLYGQVVSSNSIGDIELTNGSVINAFIGGRITLANAATTFRDSFSVPSFPDLIELGSIRVTGDGGIIGTEVETGDIGEIIVSGGFGIINSTFQTLGNDSIGDIIADGFGILGVGIQGASNLDMLHARGSGESLTIDQFSRAVRHSAEGRAYTPHFDVRLTSLTDIDEAFAENRDYELQAGQINQVEALGANNLGVVHAYRIIDTELKFANLTGTVSTHTSVDFDPVTIDGLEITTGGLRNFNPGGDVNDLDLNVAGPINNIRLNGDLLGNSSIRASGPNGNIGNVVIVGELEGNLFAQGFIGGIRVTEDMTGNVTVNGEGINRRLALGTLRVDGQYRGEVEVAHGDVGTLMVGGSFGSLGDTLYIGGSLDMLRVGFDSQPVNLASLGFASIRDPFTPEGSFASTSQGNDQINIQGLASRADGRTFGFNVATVDVSGTPTKLVQLLEFDTATAEAEVIFALQGDADLPADLQAIRAAAIDPTSPDELYFVGEASGEDRLFVADVTTGDVSAVPGTFGDTENNRDIQALAFDQTGPSSARLLALSDRGNGLTDVLVVDPTDTDNVLSSQIVRLRVAGSLTGLTLANDDPNAEDHVALAIDSSGTRSGLWRIDLTNGVRGFLGYLSDAGDASSPLRGQDLQGLTYNANLTNPFTGKQGAFLAVQGGNAELLAMSTTPSLLSNVHVEGDLGQLIVEGEVEGDTFVGGDVNLIHLTPRGGNEDTSLVNGDITIGGGLGRFELRDGDFGDGTNARTLTVADDIGRIDTFSGDLAENATIESLFGGINMTAIRDASLMGTLRADHGRLGNVLVVFGSDLGANATISGDSAGKIRFDGTIRNGAVIDIENDAEQLLVGQDIESGASLSFGSLGLLDVGGDMFSGINAGNNAAGTAVRIDGDWSVGADSSIGSDVNAVIGGALTGVSGASLHLGGLVQQLIVQGAGSIDLFIDDAANRLDFASLADSVITVAHDVTQFLVAGDVTNTLVQAGISAGDDGEFAATPADADDNEATRIADMTLIRAANVTDSIFAAGGTIGRVETQTATDSSFSAGLVLGSEAIRAVIDDASRLADASEQNAARSGGDRVLYHGDVDVAIHRGSGLVGSYLTAGVDAGAAGDFSSPDVLSSVTGGDSGMRVVIGTNAAGSRIVSDAAIRSNRTANTGGTVTNGVTYDVATDLATGQGNPLEGAVAPDNTAAAGDVLTLTVGGQEVTFIVRGPGQLEVFDDDLTDGEIDAVVFNNTDARTRVDIQGAPDIARMLFADDATLNTLNFDGDLVGDGTDAVDLWVDGGMISFTIGDLGDAVVGQIGGDINRAALDNQGAAQLRIGGDVSRLDIATGTGTPLQEALGAYAGEVFNTISIDLSGDLWAHAGDGELYQLDPTSDGPLSTPDVTATDVLSGAGADVLGMDFLSGTLYAAARLYDPQPTETVGSIQSGGVSLSGLAVDAAGDVWAVNTDSGTDELVRLDAETGEMTVVGELRSPFTFDSDVMAMTFDNAGRLLALVSDPDGDGPASAEAALVEIATTATNGRVIVSPVGSGGSLDGGGVTDAFTGLAVAPDNTLFAVRRTGGANDALVSINTTTQAITTLGNIQIDSATDVNTIESIAFDANGNLVAFDNDGSDARLLVLDSGSLTSPADFAELTPGESPLSTDLDAFALGGSVGSNLRGYAYDTDSTDGTLYENPIDTADTDGRVIVLGTIGTSFNRVTTLTDGAGDLVSLPDGADRLALTTELFGGDILFVTTDAAGGSELQSYSTITGASSTIGNLLDSSGRNVTVDALDFNTSTGDLVGLDLEQQRFVTIDPANAGVTSRSETGVISSQLTDLAYDASVGTEAFFGYEAGDADSFVEFRGTTQENASGIVLRSVDNLTLGSPYSGRIVATGNTFRNVTLDGDFAGSLVTAGDLLNLTQRSGVFGGTVEIGGELQQASFLDDVADTAKINVGEQAGVIVQRGGDFAGTLQAGELRRFDTDGDATSDASITIAGDAVDVMTRGNFAGSFTADNVTTRLMVIGELESGGSLDVERDAGMIRVLGGSENNTSIAVGGEARMLDVFVDHRGVARIGHSVQSRVMFDDVTAGELYVGGGGDSLTVRGDAANGLFVYGVSLGSDAVFNTADDVIYGGSLRIARFSGEFEDSVLSVGLLPAASAGSGWQSDHRNLLRTETPDGSSVTNAVEAGGLRRSGIDTVVMDEVVHADVNTPETQPLVATADGIGRSIVRDGVASLAQQQFDDPFGAPTVLSVSSPSEREIEILFSESVNSESLRLSEQAGDSGTVVVEQSGQRLTDVELVYSETAGPDGTLRGVLTITRELPFDAGSLQISLLGTGANTIVDRSGTRSYLRTVGDPAGTLLDGDNSGAEGGDFGGILTAGDLADDFDEEIDDFSAPLGGSITITGSLESSSDTDIFSFSASAGEFFSVDYIGVSDALLGVFELDDQGTSSDSDDTYELLARWEQSAGLTDDNSGFVDPELFQAFETPTSTTYYVAVAGDTFGTLSDNGGYTIELTRTANPNDLATEVGATLTSDGRLDFGGGNEQYIAYVSNSFRVSKQLLYLDFDGGVSQNTGIGTVTFEALDAGVLDISLDGQTDRLINGGSGVTGIMDNVASILDVGSYLPNLPGASSLNVQTLGSDLSAFNTASTGIFITTVDPTLSGLDPDEDFSTVLVGQSDANNPGLLGIAEDIDVAGQEIAEEAIVLAENYAGVSSATNLVDRFNEYSRALANVVAHEYLHSAGFNHQPTNFTQYQTLVDDPNNDGDDSDSNDGNFAIMAYAPFSVELAELGQLGTADLSDSEFPVGQIDTASLFVRWFS